MPYMGAIVRNYVMLRSGGCSDRKQSLLRNHLCMFLYQLRSQQGIGFTMLASIQREQMLRVHILRASLQSEYDHTACD